MSKIVGDAVASGQIGWQPQSICNPHAQSCQYGYGDQLPAVESRGQQLGTGSDGEAAAQTAWSAVAGLFRKHTISATVSARDCGDGHPCCLNDPRKVAAMMGQ